MNSQFKKQIFCLNSYNTFVAAEIIMFSKFWTENMYLSSLSTFLLVVLITPSLQNRFESAIFKVAERTQSLREEKHIFPLEISLLTLQKQPEMWTKFSKWRNHYKPNEGEN